MAETTPVQTKGGWKSAVLRAAPWLLLLAVLAALAVAHGLERSFTNAYEIMDGDWQNYNPVRRLLAGQVPYRDFTVYLGAGELYSVAAVLLAVGNSFGRSMLATNFLTWFFFELLVLAAALAVLRRGRPARAAVYLLCTTAFLAVHGSLGALGQKIAGLLTLAAANGNSARMIRSGGLSLAVLLLCLGVWQWQRAGKTGVAEPQKEKQRHRFFAQPCVFVPLVAGALVPWSNDMGAALYISVALGYGLWLIRCYGREVKVIVLRVIQYVVVSLFGLAAAVLLVSVGHPLAWLRQTRGAGADQAWYYGSTETAKLLHVSQIPYNAALIGTALLAVGCAVWLFVAKRRENALAAVGGFVLCTAMVLWHAAYCTLSASPSGPIEGCSVLLFALVPLLAVRLAMETAKTLLHSPTPDGSVPAEKTGRFGLLLRGTAALLGIVVAVTALGAQRQARAAGRGAEYTYVPGLGAWLGDQSEKLATEQTMAAGGSVWGTYAGALETLTGQFQPSGTDYIIHVLGDRQRLAYLTQFQSGSYDWVETPSVKVSAYERWSRNANWWFYRELYRYWTPAGTTFACGGMHVLWKKGADASLEEHGAVLYEQTAPDTVTITVSLLNEEFCGVADVALHYQAGADFCLGGTGTFLHAEAVTEKQLCEAAGRESFACDFYLSADKTQANIPVTIANGTGVVVLKTLSAKNPTLTVQSAAVEGLFQDWEYFFE